MKRLRLLVAVAMASFILAGACSNPTAPRYPQEKTDPDGPPGPDQQGFLQVAPSGILFV